MLQKADELISFDLAIAEACGQEPRPDRLACMYRYNGSATIGMTKEVVAAFDSGRDDLSAGDPRKAAHATVIF